MSDSFGMGDGNDVSRVGLAADARIADARRHQPHPVGARRWPGAAMVVRALLALFAAVVIAGWVATAFNGGA